MSRCDPQREPLPQISCTPAPQKQRLTHRCPPQDVARVPFEYATIFGCFVAYSSSCTRCSAPFYVWVYEYEAIPHKDGAAVCDVVFSVSSGRSFSLLGSILELDADFCCHIGQTSPIRRGVLLDQDCLVVLREASHLRVVNPCRWALR